MKRTARINLERMRKQPRFKPSSLAAMVGGALTLGGCGSDTIDATIYKSIEACVDDNPGQYQMCEIAYKNAIAEAVQTAPRYQTAYDCRAEFGECLQPDEALTQAQALVEDQGPDQEPIQLPQEQAGGSWFMPAMAGFMLGQALSSDGSKRSCRPGLFRSNQQCRGSQPMYTGYGPLYGGYYNAAGKRVADATRSDITRTKVAPETFTSRPRTARTLSRGGFGAMARSKSAWGGGSKSSWGG